MRKLITLIMLVLGISTFVGCHKDEWYVCYLYEEDAVFGTSLIETFDNGWKFAKKKRKEDCEEERAKLEESAEENGIDDVTYRCECDWEPD